MNIPPSFTLAQKVIGVIFALSCLFTLGAIIYTRSLWVFQVLGVPILALWGILLLCLGTLQVRKVRRYGQQVGWYNDSTVRFGIAFLLMALILLVNQVFFRH